jgi:hypothetical protein
MNQNHHLSEKTYYIGDTVGIRFRKVYILPCKVLEVKNVNDSKSVYKIFSKDGILKIYYSDEDLVDVRTVCFPGLNSTDPNLLLEISHIQACQKNRTVNETVNLVCTCNCAGKCNTMRCSCRKSKIPC